MRVVVDTNVFVSGVFFSGPPHEILEAWRDRRLTLVVSPEILAEYQATGDELASQFPDVDLTPWLELVATLGVIVQAPSLSEQVCADPDDDKFLACAIAGRTRVVTSGDKALRATSGFRGVTVLTPRQFVDKYLA
jgi:putative PIN family toxin of toxin-antitoxin system